MSAAIPRELPSREQVIDMMHMLNTAEIKQLSIDAKVNEGSIWKVRGGHIKSPAYTFVQKIYPHMVRVIDAKAPTA